MRVLMLTIELPYLTGGGGGNLRQYHMIRELSRRHEIWLVSAALPWEMEKVAEVAPFCERLEIVPHRFRFRPPKRRWHYWLNRVTYLRSPYPFEVERFQHLLAEFRRRVELLCREGTPEVLDVEQSNIAHWGSLVPRQLPRVLVMYDVLTDVARLKLGLRRPWREKLVDRIEHLKTRRYERRHLRDYGALVVVSDADLALVRALAPGASVSVVPNGVDTGYFVPGGAADDGANLVFTGSMGHPPNEDGVLYFGSQIYPLIKARRPEVRFCVVGRSPSERVLSLNGCDGITVTGEVPDVRPYLQRAAVVVVPLRFGGGTRLKILEALAMGKAVVSTRLGAAGLGVEDSRDLLLADEPEGFADAVVGLLGDPQRRAQLGQRGRDLVETRYEWRPLAGRMDAVYAGVAAGHSDGGA